jgi:hypothetical protein
MKGMKLLLAFFLRRAGSCTALYAYFNMRRHSFLGVGGVYCGMFGLVRVQSDIYGYEVRLGWPGFAPMLDCSPAFYGLTSEQADTLFDAILSCVPGSVRYVDKQVRLGRMMTEGGV